jgi:hypothetical protein
VFILYKMCWNADVSLNTFLFSVFVLVLIFYNNTFTKYKMQEFDNKWMYIFLASIIFMQLIEFFIWRYIDNKFYNNLFSVIAMLLILVQPITSIMLLTNIQLRNILLASYSLLAVPFTIYNLLMVHSYSDVSKSGHLIWNFFGKVSGNPIIYFIWLCFFFFSFLYEKMWPGLIFGIFTLVVSVINYKNDNSMWSMWCWVVNSVMIYYAFYLLLYLPFLEKSAIC